ncbi:MAG: glycosyltransferase family 39 protein [Planctomycetales bacterium]
MANHRARRVCIGLLLALHAGLAIDAARRLTVTHDEYWHLPAGLLAWKTGRFDFDQLNPPLTRLWGALPLLFTSAEVDSQAAAKGLTELGDQFLEQNRANYELYFTLARSMNVVWSLLTAWLLARWGRSVAGEWGSCLAVALWTCCPTVLANAALITPDMGGACLFFATLYAAWRMGGQTGWRRALGLGVLLGLAQLAKFTNVLLYPLVPMFWFVGRRDREPTANDARSSGGSAGDSGAAPPPEPSGPGTWKARLRSAICYLAVAYCTSGVVLNAGYLFRGSFRSWGDYTFGSESLQPFSQPTGWWRHLPIPFPSDFVQGLDEQRRIMEGRHPVYLDGTLSLVGFGEYFLCALAYKMPHAAQWLFALALLFQLRPGKERVSWRREGMFWLPVLIMVGIGSSTRMQLGLRYVLPAFPFLHLLAAESARWVQWKRYRVRTVLVGLGVALLPLSLRHHPHHLAYFNEASGGPVGGRRHLLDSNLDWGQDLRELKRFLDDHQIDDVGLAYFGMLPPASLDIHYHLPPPRPQPGWFAVSVNFLQGRPHTIRNPDGSMRSVGVDEFGWLRGFVPVARVGHSIDVFHIAPEELRGSPPVWRRTP